MDLAFFGQRVEEIALAGIFFILTASYLWAVISAFENGRQDHIGALALLLVVVLLLWRIDGADSDPFTYYQKVARGIFKALVGGDGLHGLLALGVFVLGAFMFCMGLAFFISQRAIQRVPTILGSMDASQGREYDLLRAAVVAADGIVVEGLIIRRGRLEKTDLVCEDGTRYDLVGALLSRHPPRLILPDGRALGLGLRKPGVDSPALVPPPPLPPHLAQPKVDMKRWEDDLQW